jgi:cytidine deaminase
VSRDVVVRRERLVLYVSNRFYDSKRRVLPCSGCRVVTARQISDDESLFHITKETTGRAKRRDTTRSSFAFKTQENKLTI